MPTISDLVTEVRDTLDEPTAAQWSDTQLRKWLNEANRDIARSSRHFRDRASLTTVSGQAEYALPANVLAVEQAWYDDGSRQLPLTPRHMENMDAVWGERQDWEGAYPSYFTTLGFAPTITMLLYPVPATASHTIRLLVSRLPADIPLTGSDDADVETVAQWYDALVDYCEYKALRKDRDPRWQEARQAYIEKRDGLINTPDYHTAAREMVADPIAGYLPAWLVGGDPYGY